MGSPKRVRMDLIAGGSVMKAMRRIAPSHGGQSKAKLS
jgi:hypothetical protein